jgi:hypothetical protein
VRRAEAPPLIVVAYAVAPGPGGPEGQVNLELLRALAEDWPADVVVISGGGAPRLRNGALLADLPGWAVHALGEIGHGAAEAPRWSRLAAAGVRQIRRGGPGAIPARAIERYVHRRTGLGLKMLSWQAAASRTLERELARRPGALVWSRALPFASIAAVGAVHRHRRFRWLVNLNDPMPSSVWPGLYAIDPWTDRKTAEAFRALLPGIGGFTFPSERLRDLEVAAFPEMARLPCEVFPHIAVRPDPGAVAHTGGPPRLRLAFAGTLRKDRARGELTRALAMLREREPAVSDDLEVSFHLARPTPFANGFVESLPVRTRISLQDEDGGLRLALSEADVLLDLECEADRPLLLTKVVNYLGMGKPIWAVCEPEGTTWDLVRGGWGYASRLGDPEDLLRTLLAIHRDWSAGRLAERAPSQELLGRFSGERQVKDLLALARILAERPGERS